MGSDMHPFFTSQALSSAAVLLIACMVCAAMRKSPAAHRHFVWMLAFTSLLAIPPVAWMVAPHIAALPSPRLAPVVTVTVESTEIVNPSRSSLAIESSLPWGDLFTGVWLAGSSVFLLRVGAGLLACRRRRRVGVQLNVARELMPDPALKGSSEILTSAAVSMPETFGLIRPVVLLPAAARDWTHERLRIVLLHELLHVRRRDWAASLVARLATAVFWFNPLAWYGLARLRDEREQACDDDVLRFGVAQTDYAQQLVEIARAARSDSPALAVAMARTAHLEGRVRAILNPQLNRRRLTLKTKSIAMVPAMLVVAVASLVTAPAQTGHGSVSGTVRDPSGAVVPNVKVLMTAGTGQEIARTNETGRFEFHNVPDGNYSLTALQPGFKAFTKNSIAVTAASPVQLDVTLDIGRISETVEVGAQGYPRPQTETHLSNYSYSVDRRKEVTAVVPTQRVEPTPAADTGSGPKRIRVGGNVQPARLTNRVTPVYPAHLVASGVEGTVLMQAVIGTAGQVLSLEVRNSQVDPDLIKSAMEAVKQWRYEPTLLNGQPVEVVMSLTVDFRLKP
jgi:TonB family protein